MNVLSSRKQVARIATAGAATVGSAGLAHGVAKLSDNIIGSVADSVLVGTPSVGSPPVPLNHLLASSAPGLVSGLISGASIASGALWGQEPIDIENQKFWKRLLLGGPTRLYNKGIQFREEMAQTASLNAPGDRFIGGLKSGFKVGSELGGVAGRIQGSVTGGYIGWQYSGEAVRLSSELLQGLGAPLPPIVSKLMPMAVTAGCIIAGQAVGGLGGELLGRVAGGTAVGVTTGLYASVPKS